LTKIRHNEGNVQWESNRGLVVGKNYYEMEIR